MNYRFFVLYILFWVVSIIGLTPQFAIAQLLDTVYTHREIDFFEENEELEGFDEKSARLIPDTDIFINFNVGAGFAKEKKNLETLQNLVSGVQSQFSTGGVNLTDFRENSIIPYQLGFNTDVFIFDYYGVGFTYTRNHYFSHLKKVSVEKSTSTTNYYNETVGYEMNATGNNFQFSLMGRYPFSSTFVNNIYFVGGLGYSLSTLTLIVKFEDKINEEKREQEYTSLSHSFHLFTELMFKVSHFNFGFGFLLNTITFTDYKLPDDAVLTPQKYEAVKLAPIIYFKIGFNF